MCITSKILSPQSALNNTLILDSHIECITFFQRRTRSLPLSTFHTIRIHIKNIKVNFFVCISFTAAKRNTRTLPLKIWFSRSHLLNKAPLNKCLKTVLRVTLFPFRRKAYLYIFCNGLCDPMEYQRISQQLYSTRITNKNIITRHYSAKRNAYSLWCQAIRTKSI